MNLPENAEMVRNSIAEPKPQFLGTRKFRHKKNY
jgi:hypothetical protein